MAKRFRFIILFSCLLATHLVVSDTIPQERAIVISDHATIFENDVKWRFSLGDNAEYSKVDFDDAHWKYAKTHLFASDSNAFNFKGYAWFRLHIKIDSAAQLKTYVLSMSQLGSCQIFYNGKFVKEIGAYKAPGDERKTGNNDPFFFVPLPGDNIIAIRYENREYEHSYHNASGMKQYGFESRILPAEEYWKVKFNDVMTSGVTLTFFVYLFTIGLVHFLLFIFYRARRSNLHFSLFCFLFSYYFLHPYLLAWVLNSPVVVNLLTGLLVFTIPIAFLSLLTVLYSLFYAVRPKLWKYLMWAVISCSIALFIDQTIGFIMGVLIVVIITIEMLRVIIVAIRKRKKGAFIIASGFGTITLFLMYMLVVFFILGYFYHNVNLTLSDPLGIIFWSLLFLSIIGLPFSMSTFLAWDFAQTSKTLSKKLIEVEELSAKTIEQEKEKQKMLAEQNIVLEMQVKERTSEINEQKKVIEEKNKDITDSINYAQRIQRSILPTEQEINDIFKESFVLFKPRDIVSGDFYQFKKNGDHRYAILADCTGHGVPGALMSMIGSNLLKQIILERGTKEPNKILSELHKEVRSTLRQTGGAQSHDGMDASVVLLHNKKLFIASANRPVYIVKSGELTELKPDKRSIGGSQSTDEITFTLNEIEIQTGMMVYLFSDGYADQFGGEAGKKFKVKNLSQLLLSIHTKPLNTQKEILDTTFDNWKKLLEQVDDVSLIGIRF